MTSPDQEALLSPDEIRVARQLAEGDRGVARQAQDIFERHVAAWVRAGRKDICMAFLSEAFSRCPDLTLRAQYRKRVLEIPG